MVRLTFRTKLLLSHVGLVAAVVLLVGVLLERSLVRDLENRLDDRLVAQAHGLTEWVGTGRRHLDKLAVRLSAVVGAEVAIFDSEGHVAGASTEEARSLPAGSALPELDAARAQGIGRATRLDSRGELRMHYVAVTTSEGLIVRLGAPASETEAPATALRRRLVLTGLVAVLAAFVLGLLASRLATRPLATMAGSAARIARGDYDVVLPRLAPDEFGALADTLATLARRLKADLDRIQRLEVTRRDFVANVAHELRTPVAAIRGYAETLMEGRADPSRAASFVDAIHKHADRLSNLVEGLLRLSELESAPRDAAARAPVDLQATARDVAETLRGRAIEVGATVRIDVGEGCVALADPVRLEQVLENLVDNALKYGRPEGLVVVSAEPLGERLRIVVEDDGPGIDAEHRARLFERFYRIDAGRSRDRGGAGLGLAIVKHLVESMGGKVWIEGDPGDGARVVVELPSAVDVTGV